jgi:lysophospholipase L1-like esterase
MGDEYSSRGGPAGDVRAARLWRWWPAVLCAIGVGALAGLGFPEFLSNPPVPVRKPVVVAEPAISTAAQEPSNINTPAAIKTQVAAKPHTGKLATFYNALAGLETGAGAGTSPVTVLHLGDSHIASDRITGEVRKLMQARFGDAGRGLMMPGFPFPYYKAPGFDFEKIGEWTAANSLIDEGIYGISGVSLTSASPDAALVFTSTGAPFASAEVILLKAPGNGDAVISAGDLRQEVSTDGEQSELGVPLDGKASSVKIEAKGDGPITVLGWSVSTGRPGVRYVNLGIPGASALTTTRFDRDLAASDIRDLAPKLVVLGYGTNEGFIDSLDLDAYAKGYERLIALVKNAAPDASLVILGPLDGARLPRFVKAADKAELPCHAFSDDERANYDALVAAKDEKIAHWFTPPKLEAVRQTLKKIAERHDALYWDMSTVMGGPCSIESWVKATPPLAFPDHVHLSDEGSRRVGRALYATLLADYDRHGRQADGSDASVPPGAAAPRVAGR